MSRPPVYPPSASVCKPVRSFHQSLTGGILHDATQALIHSGQGIVTALIWPVVYILPQALLYYAAFRVLRRFYRRRRRTLPPAPSAAKE